MMNADKVKIVHKRGGLGSERAIKGIQSVLSRYSRALNEFSLYGELVDLPSAPRLLRQRKKSGFHLEGNGFDFHLASVGSYDLELFQVRTINTARISWDDWVEEFATGPDFVMAWLTNADYDYWQNAYDPLQYTARGKPYLHLPMKSNGLPPPVQKEIIDISRNPGRFSLRTGYIEAVGSLMWLGQLFWKSTTATKDDVIAQDWLKHDLWPNGVLRIQVLENAFTSSAGVEGSLQERLRALLYPVAAA